MNHRDPQVIRSPGRVEIAKDSPTLSWLFPDSRTNPRENASWRCEDMNQGQGAFASNPPTGGPFVDTNLFYEDNWKDAEQLVQLKHSERTLRVPRDATGQVEHDTDPLSSLQGITSAVQAMEHLKHLRNVVQEDPFGVEQSLKLVGVQRTYSTKELVDMIQSLIEKAMPCLMQDIEALFSCLKEHYGTHPLSAPSAPMPDVSRDRMQELYGSPKAVIEKQMSNREYMSRFRLNTKFALSLLPPYEQTTTVPILYGALERLVTENITICVADGRTFQVVYELARTIKNDWLHHRFTVGWAELVRHLHIEIGDMLVFERWTHSRKLLHLTIKKERQMHQAHSEDLWIPFSRAEKMGQF
jgi:hypothetical protein